MKDLILSVLNGEASVEEKRTLDSWRNESSENERVYQEYVLTWDALTLHTSQEPVTTPPSVEEVVAGGNRRRQRAIPLEGRHSRGAGMWRWFALAGAAAAATVVLGAPALLGRQPDMTVSTGPNELRTVALGDGSVVRLGPGSHLEFRHDNTRQAELTGSGFFAVATDSASPFVVSTEVGTAEVLGTRFEVRTDAESLRLVVVEGNVALSAAGNRVLVGQGEMSRITHGAPPAVPRQVNVWDVLDWEDGLLIFQDTPLGDVVAEIGAFFDVQFSFKDVTLADRLVTAWFENESFEDVVGTVCQVVGVRCILGEGVEIAR